MAMHPIQTPRRWRRRSYVGAGCEAMTQTSAMIDWRRYLCSFGLMRTPFRGKRSMVSSSSFCSTASVALLSAFTRCQHDRP